jgi:hypothetical protein
VPNYNIYMGQGIWIPDLRGNMLVTGVVTGVGSPKDAIQSCSAIVFFNTNSKDAGLYHFPAGDVDSHKHSGLTIMQIAARMKKPIIITVVVGKLSMKDDFGNPLSELSASVINIEKLKSFILGKGLSGGGQLLDQPATTGTVTATCDANGNLVIGDQNPGGLTDLKNVKEGNHGAYRTYGFANRTG